MEEQDFQRGYINGKNAEDDNNDKFYIVSEIYEILNEERNIAGNPAVVNKIYERIAPMIRMKTAREICDRIYRSGRNMDSGYFVTIKEVCMDVGYKREN